MPAKAKDRGGAPADPHAPVRQTFFLLTLLALVHVPMLARSRLLFSSTARPVRRYTMSSASVKLAGSGQGMPLVGFGLWKVDNATCADTVYNVGPVRLFLEH